MNHESQRPPSSGHESDNRRFYKHLLEYDPRALEGDMKEIRELVETEVNFEPIDQLGVSAYSVLRHAANLLHFIEEYERRTGTTDLPKTWNGRTD